MSGNKKKVQKHATQSFEQLVGAANREALKPYIEQVVLHHVNNLSRQLGAQTFTHIGNVQTRIMALEKVIQSKFGLSEADIQNLVMDVEDEATGHKMVARPAQKGDCLRVTVSTKNKDEAEFTRTVRKEVLSLGAETPTFTKVVDDALEGMSAGESKEIALGEGAVLVRVVIDRVSEPAQAAPTEG